MNRKTGCIITGGIIVLLIFLAGCITANTTLPTEEEQRPLYIVGIDGEYLPYTFIEADGTARGFDVDSIRWIAEKKGFDVKIQPMAWDGIIPALQSGKIDMVYSGMTITDERKKMVSFSNPYWKVNQSVAVHKESKKTMDEFKAGKLIIGAQRGTTGAFWVEDNLIRIGLMPVGNLKLYDSFPDAVLDLQNKHLDAIIYDTPPLMDAIAGEPFILIGDIYTGEDIGVAFRKEDTHLLATINDGIFQLMNDPYWEELIEKYDM